MKLVLLFLSPIIITSMFVFRQTKFVLFSITFGVSVLTSCIPFLKRHIVPDATNPPTYEIIQIHYNEFGEYKIIGPQFVHGGVRS